MALTTPSLSRLRRAACWRMMSVADLTCKVRMRANLPVSASGRAWA